MTGKLVVAIVFNLAPALVVAWYWLHLLRKSRRRDAELRAFLQAQRDLGLAMIAQHRARVSQLIGAAAEVERLATEAKPKA